MNLVNSTKRLPDCPCRPGASGLTRLKSGQGGAAVITRRSAAPPGTCSTALAAAAGSSSNRISRWDFVIFLEALRATKMAASSISQDKTCLTLIPRRSKAKVAEPMPEKKSR